MEKKELRIGNWYTSAKFRVPVTCDLSDLYDLCANAEGATDHPPIDEMFEPIYLTEEWLEKFNFEMEICVNGRRCFRNQEIGRWIFVDLENEKFTLCIDSAEDGRGWKGLPYVITHNIHCYVHELQNLYYELTKKELAVRAVAP